MEICSTNAPAIQIPFEQISQNAAGQDRREEKACKILFFVIFEQKVKKKQLVEIGEKYVKSSFLGLWI